MLRYITSAEKLDGCLVHYMSVSLNNRLLSVLYFIH